MLMLPATPVVVAQRCHNRRKQRHAMEVKPYAAETTAASCISSSSSSSSSIGAGFVRHEDPLPRYENIEFTGDDHHSGNRFSELRISKKNRHVRSSPSFILYRDTDRTIILNTVFHAPRELSGSSTFVNKTLSDLRLTLNGSVAGGEGDVLVRVGSDAQSTRNLSSVGESVASEDVHCEGENAKKYVSENSNRANVNCDIVNLKNTLVVEGYFERSKLAALEWSGLSLSKDYNPHSSNYTLPNAFCTTDISAKRSSQFCSSLLIPLKKNNGDPVQPLKASSSSSSSSSSHTAATSPVSFVITSSHGIVNWHSRHHTATNSHASNGGVNCMTTIAVSSPSLRSCCDSAAEYQCCCGCSTSVVDNGISDATSCVYVVAEGSRSVVDNGISDATSCVYVVADGSRSATMVDGGARRRLKSSSQCPFRIGTANIDTADSARQSDPQHPSGASVCVLVKDRSDDTSSGYSSVSSYRSRFARICTARRCYLTSTCSSKRNKSKSKEQCKHSSSSAPAHSSNTPAVTTDRFFALPTATSLSPPTCQFSSPAASYSPLTPESTSHGSQISPRGCIALRKPIFKYLIHWSYSFVHSARRIIRRNRFRKRESSKTKNNISDNASTDFPNISCRTPTSQTPDSTDIHDHLKRNRSATLKSLQHSVSLYDTDEPPPICSPTVSPSATNLAESCRIYDNTTSDWVSRSMVVKQCPNMPENYESCDRYEALNRYTFTLEDVLCDQEVNSYFYPYENYLSNPEKYDTTTVCNKQDFGSVKNYEHIISRLSAVVPADTSYGCSLSSYLVNLDSQFDNHQLHSSNHCHDEARHSGNYKEQPFLSLRSTLC